MSSQKNTVLDIQSLVRKNILNMKPYASARDEFKGEAEVSLDANENPYPTPFNRYPDPLQWDVKEKLAVLKGVKPQHIFLGNGSDEGIDLIIRAFCEPHQDSILITEPTYGMYSVCADVNAVNVQRVLLTPETFDLDLDAVVNTIDASTKVMFLCSPNNPTGNLLSRERVETMLNQFPGIVVIDEAYIDFANSKSFALELSRYPNLIVLQTFSKAWGLAGLRLGMCFASEVIINVLNKIKYPYNVNIQTQTLALTALDKVAQKEAWVKAIVSDRATLVNALLELPLVEHVYPSDANFVLAKVRDAHNTYKYLMNKGIIVRDRSRVALCDGCLRITVGTPQENKQLIDALKTL